eukprot:XP_011683608.1 PREDICTED: major facilitator superfamily domain-containing protein 10-like [Strongylocentrotus purpuratus]
MSYNFGIFVLARIVGGIFKGNVSLSTTIVTDISTTKTRGKGMAMIGLAFSVGFIVGPMIGAYFATKGGLFAEGAWAVTPALLALTLSIADLLFVFAFLKETLPQEKRVSTSHYCFSSSLNTSSHSSAQALHDTPSKNQDTDDRTQHKQQLRKAWV